MNLPMTYEVITRKNIKVISARDSYKDHFPGDLSRWKLEAFLKVKLDFERNTTTNLVVIGDSDISWTCFTQNV